MEATTVARTAPGREAEAGSGGGTAASRASLAAKRAIDVAFACTGLVLMAPLAVVVAVAVRLDSPGPVLFRQRRVGRNGREFRILKFRSMAAGAEDRRPQLAGVNGSNGTFKIPDDPRMTRVGRVLRRSYLDELPQLWNVLRGEMSLVGPRPLPPEEDALIAGPDRRRLALRPGITGPWQVSGSWRVPLPEMVELDCRYVAEHSVWGDAKLIARTVPVVLARRGA